MSKLYQPAVTVERLLVDDPAADAPPFEVGEKVLVRLFSTPELRNLCAVLRPDNSLGNDPVIAPREHFRVIT